jgi:hypothetical protein
VPPLSCHAFGSKTHFRLTIPNILATRTAFTSSLADSVFLVASLGALPQALLPFLFDRAYSHVNAETPGCIHEGGELGYALSVSFGAVMDQPDLVVACVVGDGEAETGPTAT